MSIVYKKHPHYKEAILIRNFEGEINVSMIIESWEYLRNSQLLYPETIGVINNLTNCELKMDLSSFDQLIAYLKTQPVLKKLRLAVICINPKAIVFPFMAEKENTLHIKAFSTIEAATSWIIGIR